MAEGDRSATWPARIRGGARRAAPGIGRRLGALALFTLPAVVLWWHVWTGHPSTTLTCPCGDPAQEVWFMEWPAWALAHLANPFASGAVNYPYGANLLSNTSGTLVGLVLSPVTWLWGPVVATNVALTLAPGLSAWGCWLALRRVVSWRGAAVPGALVYGYSAAVVGSLIFAHVSVTVLVVPPLLFVTLHDIVARQARGYWRDGALLAALIVVQFLISPEILVMCVLFAVVGLVVAAASTWRTVRLRLPYAARALAVGLGVPAVLLAYPAWYGLAGPQSVSGVLFALAPLSGVFISGFLSPGAYGARADTFFRFGGYLGHTGPPVNYLGWGLVVTASGALAACRRRPVAWLLALLALVALTLSLGAYLLGGSFVLSRVWLPWRTLGSWPILREILPDQLAPFVPLFLAFLLALGLDGAHGWLVQRGVPRPRWVAAGVALAVGAAALVPLFVTYDVPFRVHGTAVPRYMAVDATRLPARAVLLTVPFAVSGSTAPMLWQAVDDISFRLAGAGLKTPAPGGGPVQQGPPGSARRLLTTLTIAGAAEPRPTAGRLDTVRRALRRWQVTEVVVNGPSRDPLYAVGFVTAALGQVPRYVHHAWVWQVPPGGPRHPPALGAPLARCRAASRSPRHGGSPLAVPRCVLGRPAVA